MTPDKGASALLAHNLTPSMSEMETQATTAILTEHYTQRCKNSYCVTEDTIPAVGVEGSMNGVGGT